MIRRQFVVVAVLLNLVVVNFGYCVGSGKRIPPGDTYTAAALKELREVLRTQNEWVKVHAAEYLLWAGYPEGVKEVYLNEEKQYGTQPPYRIGIWRVLAQASSQPAEKNMWADKIMMAFRDTTGNDRIHASETLAKLHVSPSLQEPALTLSAIHSDSKPLSMYTRWAASYAAKDSVNATRRYLLDLLSQKQADVLQKRMAAYILRHLGGLSIEQWQQLAHRALHEPGNSDAQVYLLSAAYVAAPEREVGTSLYRQVHGRLLIAKDSPHKGNRTEMAAALAERGTRSDLPVLVSLLTNQDPIGISQTISRKDVLGSPDNADVRAAAAYAIIRIEKRSEVK